MIYIFGMFVWQTGFYLAGDEDWFGLISCEK